MMADKTDSLSSFRQWVDSLPRDEAHEFGEIMMKIFSAGFAAAARLGSKTCGVCAPANMDPDGCGYVGCAFSRRLHPVRLSDETRKHCSTCDAVKRLGVA